MITREQIGIYIKYNGDMDGYARFGSIEENKILGDRGWYEINILLQDIIRMKNNVLSFDFLSRLKTRLQENEFGDDIIDVLYNKFGTSNNE